MFRIHIVFESLNQQTSTYVSIVHSCLKQHCKKQEFVTGLLVQSRKIESHRFIQTSKEIIHYVLPCQGFGASDVSLNGLKTRSFVQLNRERY